MPVDSISSFKEEIETYNNIAIVGEPRQLVVPKSKTGSVMFVIKTEAQRKHYILRGVIFESQSLKVVNFKPFSPRTQYYKCQGFGHDLKGYKSKLTCRFYSKNHFTKDHICNTCKTIGICMYLEKKCINCSQNHIADSEQYKTIRAIKNV